MPKYLMFDHGGVLDGCIVYDGKSISDNDLVLIKYEWGGFQVLKNGVQFVNALNELVNNYGYRVVFHTKNAKKTQDEDFERLLAACREKNLIFPKVHATAVFDQAAYKTFTSADPHIEQVDGMTVVSWGAYDEDGKASLRRALESVLHIQPEDRHNHVVFDDGGPIITEAQAERYQAFLIGNQPGQISLNDAVQQVLNKRAFEKQITPKYKEKIIEYLMSQIKRLPPESEKRKNFEKFKEDIEKNTYSLDDLKDKIGCIKSVAQYHTSTGWYGFFVAKLTNPRSMQEFEQFFDKNNEIRMK